MVILTKMLWQLLVSVLLSFILCVVMIPVIMRVCNRYKLYDPVNARKIHSGNIPRLGGVAIVLSFLIGCIIYSCVFKGINFIDILPLLGAGLLIFLFGFLDDIFDLHAVFKLIVQLAATGIVIAGGYHFRQIGMWKLPPVAGYILTFFWVLGIINAYNLIDGLDGLCGGLSFLTIMTIGGVFYNGGNVSAVICFFMAASIFGFLVYNWPPAKIFMGDCGSQFLGFMIAVLPLCSSDENFEYNKFFMMIVIVAIPMMDTIAAIWRRIRDHKPIMSADRAHLHHKLLNLGYTKKQALFLLLGIQVLLCLTVCLAAYMQRSKGTILLFVAYIFMVFFFSWIHFTNRTVLMQRKQDFMTAGILDEKKNSPDKK